ncbi:MAG: glutathione peroxidase [Prevotella sp.]|nr:glutathione peroxidase [Prevotella sp.]
MKKILFLMTLWAMISTASAQSSIYKQKVKDADGKEMTLRAYRGKVMLIVNTATRCGFTPQYTELEALYEKYRDRGFVILDFPCNQFGGQAPGTYEEIHNFCTGTYNIQFPQFDKLDVNGPEASPLFTFLKKRQGFQGFGNGPKAEGMDRMMRKRDANYTQSSDIKWNFTKFLVDQKGHVVARFEPTQDISEVEKAVLKLIK